MPQAKHEKTFNQIIHEKYQEVKFAHDSSHHGFLTVLVLHRECEPNFWFALSPSTAQGTA